jgi:nitrate reductase NapE component
MDLEKTKYREFTNVRGEIKHFITPAHSDLTTVIHVKNPAPPATEGAEEKAEEAELAIETLEVKSKRVRIESYGGTVTVGEFKFKEAKEGEGDRTQKVSTIIMAHNNMKIKNTRMIKGRESTITFITEQEKDKKEVKKEVTVTLEGVTVEYYPSDTYMFSKYETAIQADNTKFILRYESMEAWNKVKDKETRLFYTSKKTEKESTGEIVSVEAGGEIQQDANMKVRSACEGKWYYASKEPIEITDCFDPSENTSTKTRETVSLIIFIVIVVCSNVLLVALIGFFGAFAILAFLKKRKNYSKL